MQLLKVHQLLKQKRTKFNSPTERSNFQHDDDDKTVIADTKPTVAKFRTSIKSFKLLLEKYKDYPSHSTIDDFEKEYQVHIKVFIKQLGISGKAKIL